MRFAKIYKAELQWCLIQHPMIKVSTCLLTRRVFEFQMYRETMSDSSMHALGSADASGYLTGRPSPRRQDTSEDPEEVSSNAPSLSHTPILLPPQPAQVGTTLRARATARMSVPPVPLPQGRTYHLSGDPYVTPATAGGRHTGGPSTGHHMGHWDETGPFRPAPRASLDPSRAWIREIVDRVTILTECIMECQGAYGSLEARFARLGAECSYRNGLNGQAVIDARVMRRSLERATTQNRMLLIALILMSGCLWITRG